MAAAGGLVLVRSRQLIDGELADHLEHPVARAAGHVVDVLHQAVLHQVVDGVEESNVIESEITRDSTDSRQSRAADADAETPEDRRGIGAEQLVAPAHGRSHGLLPGRAIAPTACQYGQISLQRVAHGVERQRPTTCRGELQGEREPVQTCTDGHQHRDRFIRHALTHAHCVEA